MAQFDVVMIGTFPEDATLIQGGVQASVYGLSGALEQHPEIGAMTVFAPPTEVPYRISEKVIGKLRVHYLKVPWRFQFSNVLHCPAVLRAVRAMPRPVVHVHGTSMLQFALCVAFAANRTPLVWTLHGITEKETLQRYREHRTLANLGRYLLYRSMERMMLRWVSNVIVDTPYVRSALTYSDRFLHIIPQGVFLDEFHQHTRVASDSYPPVILSVGVIDPRKGHHLTLKAFAQILPEFPRARLAIVGILRVDEYYRTMVETAATLGISASVDFRPNLSRHEIIELLGSSYIFALHSQEESQGIALCEALASGLPVVSTNVGGIPFVVNQGQDGFLVDYGDVDGFADALRRLLKDEALRDRMSAQAVAGSHRFSWSQTADDVIKIYNIALGQRITQPAA